MTHGRMPLAVPSATQSRISGSLCTESFQRYGSSSPTLKMPPIGLRPITERYSFARRPFAQGGVRPRRAWLSVNWMAASSPAVLRSGGPFGMKRASGLTARTVASHCFQSSVSRALRHSRN